MSAAQGMRGLELLVLTPVPAALDRALFPVFAEQLADGGWLGLSIATRSNLERHEHPSAQYLLDDGEMPSLLGGLSIVHYQEGWSLDGRHTAEVLARKL